MMEKFLCELIPVNKLVLVIQQLLSRIEYPEAQCREVIISTLVRIAVAYPSQAAWWLLPLKYFDYQKNSSNK